jgi:hypothetical protein
MSTLMHHFDGSLHSSERKSTVRIGSAETRLATANKFCLSALAMLSAGGLLAGLIVLRTAIYFSRFHF